jgi:tRNA G10  N-methylase Trm11
VNKKYKSEKETLKEKYKELDVYANFKQYGLPLPEVLRMDSIGTPFNERSFLFDSIVCDPPYGIRAAQKMTKKTNKMRKGRDMVKEKESIKKFYDTEYKNKSRFGVLW